MYNIYPEQMSRQASKKRRLRWDPRQLSLAVWFWVSLLKASRDVAEFTQIYTCSHEGDHYFVLYHLAWPWTWHEWESSSVPGFSLLSVTVICPHGDWVSYDQMPNKRQLKKGTGFFFFVCCCCLVWFLIYSLWLQSLMAGVTWQKALLMTLEASVWGCHVHFSIDRKIRECQTSSFSPFYSVQDAAHRMMLPTLRWPILCNLHGLGVPRLWRWMMTRRPKKGQSQRHTSGSWLYYI